MRIVRTPPELLPRRVKTREPRLAHGFLVYMLFFTALGWPSPDQAEAQVTAGSAAPKQPMDLTSNEVDPNGFPVNPDWHFKTDGARSPWRSAFTKSIRDSCGIEHNSLTRCTTQPVTLEGIPTHPHKLCEGVPVGKTQHVQHLNWGTAAYSGPIAWQDWQIPILDYNGKRRDRLDYDDDYDFLLAPKGREGYVHANSLHPPISLCANEGPGIGIEFGRRELATKFRSDWWGAFPQWVQSDRWCSNCCEATKNALTDDDRKPRQGMVIGTIGLDCVHDCRAEVHPVFAFAVRTEEILVKKHLSRERWSFFARNWAEGEGKCSTGNLHRLSTPASPQQNGLQRLLLLLPWNSRLTPGSRGRLGPKTALKTNSTAIKTSGVRAEILSKRGILLELMFPSPRQKAVVEGDVYLCWNNLPGCGVAQQAAKEFNPKQGRDTLNVELRLVNGISSQSPGPGPYPPVPEGPSP